MSRALGSVGSALDTQSTDGLRDPTASALRAHAATDPKAAIKAAAKQFEAIFMQQLMKSMRSTTLSSGALDNEGTKMGTDLLDNEFANQLTGMRGGLSEAIARQLERQMSGRTAAAPSTAAGAVGATGAPVAPAAAVAPSAAAGSAALSGSVSATQAEFVNEHQQAALAAQNQSGIPAAFMVAQAAHETGWGKRPIRAADGTNSHNLFGIKAGAGWTGPVAEVATTEYVNGQPKVVTAKFRAYGSDQASFQDYAQMMAKNPRYASVAAASATAQGFAQGLQRAGYATDPAYAAKLTQVINTTLRVQRTSV